MKPTETRSCTVCFASVIVCDSHHARALDPQTPAWSESKICEGKRLRDAFLRIKELEATLELKRGKLEVYGHFGNWRVYRVANKTYRSVTHGRVEISTTYECCVAGPFETKAAAWRVMRQIKEG